MRWLSHWGGGKILGEKKTETWVSVLKVRFHFRVKSNWRTRTPVTECFRTPRNPNTFLPLKLWCHYVTTRRPHPNLVTTCRGLFLQALDLSHIFQPSAREHHNDLSLFGIMTHWMKRSIMLTVLSCPLILRNNTYNYEILRFWQWRVTSSITSPPVKVLVDRSSSAGPL